MVKQDFITFGRTRIYFINEIYDVDTGIIAGILYIGDTNTPDSYVPTNINGIPLRIFTPPYEITSTNADDDVGYYILHKLSDTKNEYEYLYILRKYLYFTEDIAINYQIKALKEYILSKNDFSYKLVYDREHTDSDTMYLLYNDADLTKDTPLYLSKIDDSGNTKFENIDKETFDTSEYYRVIVKLDDKFYYTPIKDANIYNGLLNNQEFKQSELVEILDIDTTLFE